MATPPGVAANGSAVSWIRRSGALRSADSPTQLRSATGVTVLLALGLTIVGWSAIGARTGAIDDAAEAAAQLIRVQDVRVLVVQADSLASNAYLADGQEPAEQRTAYDDRIDQAAAGLVTAAGATGGNDSAELQRANELLTTYVGLVEQARANNRQGFPVGAAYQRQARTVAQEIVASLREVEQRTRSNVDDRVATSYRASWPLVLVALVLLVALLLGSRWMARRFRRLVNVPLLVATLIVGMVLVVGLWVNARAAAEAGDAVTGPLSAADLVAQARAAGFDARSNEALTLINRGNGAAYELEWTRSMSVATQALDSACDDFGVACDARRSLMAYATEHTGVRALDDGGDWEKSVEATTDPEGPLTKAFEAFASSSNDALTDRAATSASAFDDASAPLGTLRLLVALAGVAVALLAVSGYGQRLREYR